MSQMPPKSAVSSDMFKTPPSAVRYASQFIPKSWKIWACADPQDSQIVQTLKKDGYEVEGTDVLEGFDFLSTLMPIPECDCIFTNPPYSLKDQWLERCYELGKPFALLLPLTALGEQARVKMFRENGIQLIIPPERINYGTPSGGGAGSWFFSAWFCKGLHLPDQITFVEAA